MRNRNVTWSTPPDSSYLWIGIIIGEEDILPIFRNAGIFLITLPHKTSILNKKGYSKIIPLFNRVFNNPTHFSQPHST